MAFGATEKYVKMSVSPTFLLQIWGDLIEKLELRQASGLQVLDRLAYTSRVQICSRARSASGRFFMFSATKAWIIASESESFALAPEMRSEGLWKSLGFRKIHSFYEIIWIFGGFLSYEHFAYNLYSKKKKKKTATTIIRINGTQFENKRGDPIFY